MTEQRDDKLGDAIAEAQRKAIADQLWVGHSEKHELTSEALEAKELLRWDAHRHSHEVLEENIDKALSGVDRERALHVTAHEAAHVAHNREHALDSKNALQLLEAHSREHALEADALDKAASAVDKRLEGMNEVRAQLKDQALTFARVEVVQALTDRIIAIEKLDIKGEGRSIGQGAVIASIIAAIGVSATIVSMIVIIANLLSNP